MQSVWAGGPGGEDTVLIGGGKGGGGGRDLVVFTKSSVPGTRLVVPGERAGRTLGSLSSKVPPVTGTSRGA